MRCDNVTPSSAAWSNSADLILDEVKPGCERCRKAGYQCEGYVQYAEFVDVTTQFTANKSPKQKPVRNASSPSVSPRTASPSSVIELPLMPISRNPTWDEQSMFTSHLISRLFTWHDDTSSPQTSSWIEILFQRTEEEAALSFTSVRALTTTYFAKVNRKTELMRKGAGFYSRALQAIRSNLEDPNLVLEDDLIVAIICMAIYEMVTYTQPTGWLHHYKGLARLVITRLHLVFFRSTNMHQTAMRGPHRHQSGVALAILPTLRSCIVSGAT